MIRFAVLLLSIVALPLLPASAQTQPATTIDGLSPGAPIVIGLALPKQEILNGEVIDRLDGTLAGAQVAADEINAAGGIAGHPIKLVAERPKPVRDRGLMGRIDAETARKLATRLLSQRPVAVVGHATADGAIAASQLYQDNNVLYLATYATDDSLTTRSFDKVFRLTMPARYNAQALADYAYHQQMCRVLIFSLAHDQGMAQVLLTRTFLEDHGTKVVFTATFPHETRDFVSILLYILENPSFEAETLDAIFFMGEPVHAGIFVDQIRRLRFDLPIIGTDSLQSPLAKTIAGDAMDGVTTYSLFNVEGNQTHFQTFATRFEEAYGKQPSNWATLSYDAIKLVADGVRATGSVDPDQIAQHFRVLRRVAPYEGASGDIMFNLKGELIGQTINIVSLVNDAFVPVMQWSDRHDEGGTDVDGQTLSGCETTGWDAQVDTRSRHDNTPEMTR